MVIFICGIYNSLSIVYKTVGDVCIYDKKEVVDNKEFILGKKNFLGVFNCIWINMLICLNRLEIG